MEKQNIENSEFWKNLLKAADASPVPARPIRGASGQRHEALALGIDDNKKRIVIVSGEHDARSAALVQYDIQAAIQGYQVITIRPAAVSMSKFAQALKVLRGSPQLDDKTMELLGKDGLTPMVQAGLGPLKSIHEKINLKMLPQMLDLIQQLAQIKFESSDFKDSSGKAKFSFDLTRLVDFDPIAHDREWGVCPVALYDFTETDIETISSGKSADEIIHLLSKHGIYQFFFPSPDHIALGLFDRGIEDPRIIEKEIQTAPTLGHPLGAMEIVDKQTSPLQVIDALRERKLIVEGEVGLELSEDGKKMRYSVKFRPREGIISKLINQFSLRIDLKNLFRHGPE